MRPSSAGSNVSAVRVIVTPPPVVIAVESTVGLSTYFRSGPATGGRNEKSDRRSSGRSHTLSYGHRLPAAPPLKVVNCSHRGRAYHLGRARGTRVGHPPRGGGAGDHLRGDAHPVGAGDLPALEELADHRQHAVVAEQAAVERRDH